MFEYAPLYNKAVCNAGIPVGMLVEIHPRVDAAPCNLARLEDGSRWYVKKRCTRVYTDF